ncbi:MAG: polyprenyl synthetase family protein [Phycisphaerales bacterium]|nr:polyprenyl synthetase family protein [Phycisphaerales bacterium]
MTPDRPTPARTTGEFDVRYPLVREMVDAELRVRAAAARVAIGPHSRLGEAVEYALKLPGKRLRPFLVVEACRAFGGTDSAALSAACAVECLHTFSLIHDDLPAMDDDDLRRGMPTCHKVFGEAAAILAGDWLSAYALRVAATAGPDAARSSAILAALADGTLAMIEGQAADVAGEGCAPTADRVAYIHLRKTAALISASAKIGAHCAAASEPDVELLSNYGRRLGLAFQIMDDVLDAVATTEALGRAGKDSDRCKQTYPAVFGVEASRARASEEAGAAARLLEPLGSRAAALRELAGFVVHRER